MEARKDKATVIDVHFQGDGTSKRAVFHVKVHEQSKILHLFKAVSVTHMKKEHAQEDFDYVLVRAQRDELLLDPSRVLTEYTITDQDHLEARRKEIPISIHLNLCDEQIHTVEVNAALPAVNVTRVICEKLGIHHGEELSLLLPHETKGSAQGLQTEQWLESSVSLQRQGVKEGDTVMLRKKFFIKNSDVEEALEGNATLLGLLYSQLKDFYTSDHSIPTCVNMAAVSSLLHHIEQGDENISDEGALKKVLPQKLQDDRQLYERVVEAYYKEQVHSLQKHGAKCQFVKQMCQSGMSTGFQVQSPEDGQQYTLFVDSTAISLCSENKGQLVSLQQWPLELLQEWEGDRDCFRFQVGLDEWHTLNTSCSARITHYLSELLVLTTDQLSSEPEFPDTEDQVLDLTLIGSMQEEQTGRRDELSEAEMHYAQLQKKEEVIHVMTVSEDAPPEPDIVMVSFPEGYKPLVSVEVQSPRRKVKFQTEKKDFLPYFELGYKQLLQNYRLFHFVILGKDIRALLINITKPVDELILKICATYGIPCPEQYHLWIPKGLKHLREKYGEIPDISLSGKLAKKIKHVPVNSLLNGRRSLIEQYNFSFRPYILYFGIYTPDEEVDAPDDSLEGLGEEWPDFEEPNLARQREFHQCWCGVVQGDYPVDPPTAANVAALLCQVYFGDHKEDTPKDYKSEVFLPPNYSKVSRMKRDVLEAHEKLVGKDKAEAIEEVIQICRNTFTYEGIFFDVQIPVALFPWKRMKKRMFGINHQGVFSVDPKNGKIFFIHRFSDIHSGCGGENILHLDFQQWDKDYYAYTHQAKEIMEILQLFIGMTRRGQIEQAPSRPPTFGATS